MNTITCNQCGKTISTYQRSAQWQAVERSSTKKIFLVRYVENRTIEEWIRTHTTAQTTQVFVSIARVKCDTTMLVD